jgi:hypothetical protein
MSFYLSINFSFYSQLFIIYYCFGYITWVVCLLFFIFKFNKLNILAHFDKVRRVYIYKFRLGIGLLVVDINLEIIIAASQI